MVWQWVGGEDAEYPPIAIHLMSASRGQGAEGNSWGFWNKY